jgi:hypothetical protein
MAIRITCINKAGGAHNDPHCAIFHLGWLNEASGNTGRSSRLEIYEWLKKDKANQAYVRDSKGDTAYVYPRENANGTKFVQTYSDGIWKDNLLALPECVA